MAIRLANAMQCKIIVTAGDDEKCKVCDELGAHRSVNYNHEDFTKVIREEFGGVDVVLDVVGGEYISKHLDIMNRGGRHISIGFLQGSKVKDFNLLNLLARGLCFTGSTLRRRSDDAKASILEDALDRLVPENPLLLSRKERSKRLLSIANPYVTKTFALEDAAQAHALMESRAHTGKIVLQV